MLSKEEIIDVLRPFAAIADTIKFGEDTSLVYASLGSCRAARDLLSRLDAEGEAPSIGSKHLPAQRAWFTHEDAGDAGHLYYFAPAKRTDPPYLTQRHVEAIIDIASNGTLAGVELIDNMPPPLNQEGGDAVEREPRSVRESAAESGHVAPPASGSSGSGRAEAERIAVNPAARELLLPFITEYLATKGMSWGGLSNAISSALEEARVAGRRSMQEDAARVAEAEKATLGGDDGWAAGYATACDDVARAIRALNPETKP